MRSKTGRGATKAARSWRLLATASLAVLLAQAVAALEHAEGADMNSNATQQNQGPGAAAQQGTDKPKQDDLVITPAGPVRKENVHPVGPNEEVRRDKDGNYVVVPRSDQKPDTK
jgi:hypothetical protein